MIGTSIARRYARAHLAVGLAKQNQDILANELEDLAQTFAGSTHLKEALSNPAFPKAERDRVLDAVLSRMAASDMTKNLARVLLERERIELLPQVAQELRAMVDNTAGRVRGEVVSAKELSPAHIQQIQASLETATGKKVILASRVDAAVLGGVMAKVGDLVFDGTLRTQLDDLKQQALR